tara:strand:- start:28551 stop:29249 length:699 start_codon:yes stop_codon:yes gene_type:complete
MVTDEPDEATPDFPIEDVTVDDDPDDGMPTLEVQDAPEPAAETETDRSGPALNDVLPPEPEPIPNVFSPGMSAPQRKRKSGGKGALTFFIVLFLILGTAAALWFFRSTVQDVFPSTRVQYHKLIDLLGLPPEYPGAGLELDCPADKLSRDSDSAGNESITAVCTVSNITDRPVEFPQVRIRLTNINGTIIHKEEIIAPPQPIVTPGEVVVFSPTVSGVGRALRMDVDFVDKM